MTQGEGQHCCDHCLNRLGFGPRFKRILLHLVQHPEWEHDPTLEVIRFRLLDRGHHNRVAYKTETLEQWGEVA